MDDELICNYRKCRKRVTGTSLQFAWITSCSHIFCDGDGTREFTNSLICPACDTELPNKYDIIRQDLMPSEQYKAVALCGLKPETVLEICTRAIAFWNYQIHQERTYQEYLANKAREKTAQLEQYYDHVVNRLQSELNSTKKKLEQCETKCKELIAKLTEKTRQYTKLQALYEALRRRCVTPATFSEGREPTERRDHNPQSFMMNLSSRDDVLKPPSSSAGRGHPISATDENRVIGGTPRRSPPEREFMMRPNHTPLAGEAFTGLRHYPVNSRVM